jgi:signal transduction histidine kinase
MQYNFVTNINGCIESATQLMGGNLNLVYYSHIPVAVISFILGIFVIYKNKTSISAKYLVILSMIFSFWIVCNLITWVSSNGLNIMFFWSLIGMFDFLIFTFSLFLLYTYENDRDVPFWLKITTGLLFLPIVILTPTKLSITAFDYYNCTALDNLFGGYLYIALVIISLIIIVVAINRCLTADRKVKKQVLLMSSGIILFLATVLGTYYIADTFQKYSIEIYGVYMMTIFMAFLAYLIVKFKAFNIKLIGAQALVWALVIFIGSQFLYMNQMPLSSLVITGITLVLSAVIGLMIVRGIKKEIAIRERIETLAEQLELTNEKLRILDQQKTQFVSLASHQLRAPLTSIKGYLSMILEGDYGEVKGEAREMIERVEKSADNLVTVVGDFLDVSRIEQGKMRYEWTDFDLKPLVETVHHEQESEVLSKGLVFNLDIEKNIDYKIHGDMNKLKQVFTNLIDNSIKYTKKGEVNISLSRPKPKIVRFEIKDTGIGISAETLPRLFDKFVRAENANDVNVIGTGLGLFVAKEMIKAHEGGKIWAESEGLGKGSRFVVELKAM